MIQKMFKKIKISISIIFRAITICWAAGREVLNRISSRRFTPRTIIPFINIAIVLIASIFFFSFAKAANDKLPDIMVGKTSIKFTNPGGSTYYGGFAANEVVFNYEGSGQTTTDATTNTSGYGLMGFSSKYLPTPAGALLCIPGISTIGSPACFTLNVSTNNISIMTSRTNVTVGITTIPLIDTAALSYPSAPLIVGDAYLGSSDPTKFAYWGRNLTQSGPGKPASADSFWGIGNYTMNPNSQSLLSGNSYAQYTSKIQTLMAQATPITSIPSSATLYLQSSSATMSGSNDDANKYPEGKVWKIMNGNNLAACNFNSSTYYFSGLGTIICNGITVGSGTTISRTTGSNTSSLGLIDASDSSAFTGSGVSFAGNNQIYAAVFSSKSINVNLNSSFYGSFVAPVFYGNGANLPGAITNTQFYYDYKLDSNWPPGFRYLNMPHPQESN
jgi:hypothetical protein